MIKSTLIKKVCPECKKTFDCEHSATCWCSGFDISKKTMEFLNKNYSDCLCKECLEKATKLISD